MTRRIRTYHEVGGASDLPGQVEAQRGRLHDRLRRVGAVVPVLSGKGGVGKSALTANLAVRLTAAGRRVGALDADLNGPSLARMLGASGTLGDGDDGVVPVRGVSGVPVISMELLQEEDAPLRWREPGSGAFLWQSTLETGVLREFLSDVAWGDLDVLLIDVPPGTDKIRRLLELVPRPELVLLVTTPSEAAARVVGRAARLLGEAGPFPVGLVANMAGYACPDCGSLSPLFPGPEPEESASALGLPLFGAVPFDPALAAETDGGRPAGTGVGSASALALDALVTRVAEALSASSSQADSGTSADGGADGGPAASMEETP